MTRYETIRRKIQRVKKYRELKTVEKMTLLALARECDRQEKDEVDLSEDELQALISKEILIHTLELCKKTCELFFEDYEERKALNYISNLCNSQKIDIEQVHDFIRESNKRMSTIPADVRKQLVLQNTGMIEQ